MAPQLLIRPGPNDHLVVEDLLAPGGSAIFRVVGPWSTSWSSMRPWRSIVSHSSKPPIAPESP